MVFKLPIILTMGLVGSGGYVWMDEKQSLNLKITQLTNLQQQETVYHQQQKIIEEKKIKDGLIVINTPTQEEKEKAIEAEKVANQEIKAIQDQIDAKAQQIKNIHRFTHIEQHQFIIEHMTKTKNIDDAWAKDPQNIACLKQRTRTTQQKVLLSRCFENLVTQKTTK